MVDEAKPPMPLVSSHSRRLANPDSGRRIHRIESSQSPDTVSSSAVSQSVLPHPLAALLQQLRHQAGPSGLMARADAGAVVAVEVLVEQHQVPPVRIALIQLDCRRAPAAGRPSSFRKMRVSRREISAATSHSVIIWPEPVGHSTLKSSPR